MCINYSIFKYFPKLSQEQKYKFLQMKHIYEEINKKINLISRRDIKNIYEHHILHSLSIAKVVTFTRRMTTIDVGTGGGFPGIPLAILFPNVEFTLIDSIQKKINALNEIVDILELKNVKTECIRSENFIGEYDCVLGRAVTNIEKFILCTKHLLSKNGKIIYLHGCSEVVKYKCKSIELKNIFQEEYFLEKKITIVEKGDI